MINYIDYNYYVYTYKGYMPKSDFDKIVNRASYEIQKSIFNRDITGYETEVKLATCSVANLLYKIERLKNKKQEIEFENVLKSESVADYSRTFESLKIDEINNEISNLKNNIKEEIKSYLSITGLLFRGV